MSAKCENDGRASQELSVLRTLVRARAPALPVLTCFMLSNDFLGKAKPKLVISELFVS
jgi:hypothetical protein